MNYLFFGLCTESKYLIDLYTSNQANIQVYGNIQVEGVQGTIQEGLDYLSVTKVDQVICCSSKVAFKDLLAIKHLIEINNTPLYVIPCENFKIRKQFDLVYLDKIIAYRLKPNPLNHNANISLKRLFDIAFSLCVILLLLSWLLPILALLIILESKGNPIFSQRRNGLHNREFICYKLRSMKVNSVADTKQATQTDTRITKVGAFLRKTSLDEMPQFFNVLKGDMSIVGPRPHMVKHNQYYSELISDYNYRTNVKPGITGLAQVLGYRGETESDVYLMKIRIRVDNFYIRNWSLWLDIKIIFQTVFRVLRPTDNTF